MDNFNNFDSPIVYFIQGKLTKLIKIGRCERLKNLSRRLSEINVSSPDELIILGILYESEDCTEAMLHAGFIKYWVKGEWFKPDRNILKFIKTHASPIDIKINRRNKATDIKYKGKQFSSKIDQLHFIREEIDKAKEDLPVWNDEITNFVNCSKKELNTGKVITNYLDADDEIIQ